MARYSKIWLCSAAVLAVCSACTNSGSSFTPTTGALQPYGSTYQQQYYYPPQYYGQQQPVPSNGYQGGTGYQGSVQEQIENVTLYSSYQ